MPQTERGKALSMFDRSKPRTIADVTFGRLSYQRSGFWEGMLAVGNMEVEVVVDAGEDGPLQHWELVLTAGDSHYYCVRMNRDRPEALRIDG